MEKRNCLTYLIFRYVEKKILKDEISKSNPKGLPHAKQNFKRRKIFSVPPLKKVLLLPAVWKNFSRYFWKNITLS